MLLHSASAVVRRLPPGIVFLAPAAEEFDEQEACFIFHDAGGYFAAVVEVGKLEERQMARPFRISPETRRVGKPALRFSNLNRLRGRLSRTNGQTISHLSRGAASDNRTDHSASLHCGPMERAFSPSEMIQSRNLGRWPRLV